MGKAISRGFKRGLAVILAALILCSLSVTSFAKREDNPLQNYDKMTIKGTDSMTLVFHKYWGGEVEVPVDSIYLKDGWDSLSKKGDNAYALFMTSDESLYQFQGLVTRISEANAEPQYKFTIGRLTSENTTGRTDFIDACDVAMIYMAMFIDYDATIPENTRRAPYYGKATKENIDFIVGFVSQLLNTSSANPNQFRKDENGKTFINWGMDNALATIQVFFDITRDDVKMLSFYEKIGKTDTVRVYPCPTNDNYLDMRVSVRHDGDVWRCRETYWNKDGRTSSFSFALNDYAQITEMVPDEYSHPAGDIDGNGSTDITDAMLLFYHVAKKSELTPDQQNRAHSNLDWTTDIGDAISLFYYVAKKSDTFFTPVHPASEI